MDIENFLLTAELIHGKFYDYSLVDNCKSKKQKIKILCPTHGEFSQRIVNHLNMKQGCPSCGKSKKFRLTKEQFIDKAKSINRHLGKEYDYSKVVYKTTEDKVIIICPDHGEFEQTPHFHTSSSGGCFSCSKISRGLKRRKSSEKFIEEAKLYHGDDKFDFSKTEYKTKRENILVRCIKHNLEFEYHSERFLTNKFCCPNCVIEESKKVRTNLQDFIELANQIHKNQYDYSKSIYNGVIEKLEIVCKKHGSFWQSPNSHTSSGKSGCPTCSASKGEGQVREFLITNNIKFEEQKSFQDCRDKGLLRFDFFLSDLNIAIEYNGQQHYEPIDFFGGHEAFESLKTRDKIKSTYCIANAIKLITIPHYTDSSSLLSGLI